MTRLIPSDKVLQIKRYVNKRCHIHCSSVPIRADSDYEFVLAFEPYRPPTQVGKHIADLLNKRFLMTFDSGREKLVFKEVGLGARQMSWGISAEVVPCAEQL